MELNSELDRAQANYKRLVEMIAKMREHQKAYFRYRTPDDLREAKKLEKQVDAEIQKATGTENSKKEVEHPRLF